VQSRLYPRPVLPVFYRHLFRALESVRRGLCFAGAQTILYRRRDLGLGFRKPAQLTAPPFRLKAVFHLSTLASNVSSYPKCTLPRRGKAGSNGSWPDTGRRRQITVAVMVSGKSRGSSDRVLVLLADQAERGKEDATDVGAQSY
jgi:hypothetical protein